jgi:hypothetical protein
MKKKGFNQKHYREIRQFVDSMVASHPWCYDGSLEDWLKMWMRLIKDRVKDEDYEAAKAIKDSIREFLNKYTDEPIPENALLNLDNA